jgi:hypothetical protein
MSSFTPLYGSILTSTVWSEDSDTRIVWITMLAMADAAGYVGASLPGLAHAARVELEICEKAIHKFLSPDKHSRTKSNDGRRISEVDGGWILINYASHRERSAKIRSNILATLRKRKQREKDDKRVTSRDSHDESRNVTPTEAEAETESEKNEYILPDPTKARASSSSSDSSREAAFIDVAGAQTLREDENDSERQSRLRDNDLTLNAEDALYRQACRLLTEIGAEMTTSPADKSKLTAMIQRGGLNMARDCLESARKARSSRPVPYAQTVMENRLASKDEKEIAKQAKLARVAKMVEESKNGKH